MSAAITAYWKNGWGFSEFRFVHHPLVIPPVQPGHPSGLKSRNSPDTIQLKKIKNWMSNPWRTDNYIHHRVNKHFVNQDLHMAWNKTRGNIRKGARENSPSIFTILFRNSKLINQRLMAGCKWGFGKIFRKLQTFHGKAHLANLLCCIVPPVIGTFKTCCFWLLYWLPIKGIMKSIKAKE